MEQMKGNEVLYTLFTLTATIPVLDYLDEHGEASYGKMMHLASTFSLTISLRFLLKTRLVEHNIDRRGKKREWYSITGKGRKVIKIVREIVATRYE